MVKNGRPLHAFVPFLSGPARQGRALAAAMAVAMALAMAIAVAMAMAIAMAAAMAAAAAAVIRPEHAGRGRPPRKSTLY